MNGSRNAWIAARARNAARRGSWIISIGGVVFAATLWALVMVPRTLDRQLRERLAALPVVADSLPIVRRLDDLHAQQRTLQTPPRDTVVAPDTSRADSATDIQGVAPADSAVTDLAARANRARKSPLPDSYRSLAESPLMKGDPRVRALLDSIEKVDREREAHAALGGPGARYAVLTTRLTVLGQRLVHLAEQQLERAAPPIIESVSTRAPVTPDSALVARAKASADSATQSRRDSLLGTLMQRVSLEESVLTTLRRDYRRQDSLRVTLEQRFQLEVPPFAMMVAALAIGIAFGYGIVLARELRRPTVGDALEVEQLTATPVLRHARETATARIGRRRWRERPGIPPIVDRESDTFVVLHLSLSTVGDVVEQVDVLADNPVLAAAVALGTAAAATRESRAVLVVGHDRGSAVLVRLLRLGSRPTMTAARTGPARSDPAVHVVTLDRDAHIDVRLGESGVAANEASGPRPSELDTRYDLRLHVQDADTNAPPASRDVILCVRQGATPLAWLSRATAQAHQRQQTVRAVVLWSRDVPTGS